MLSVARKFNIYKIQYILLKLKSQKKCIKNEKEKPKPLKELNS